MLSESNLALLKSEIQLDPANVGYAGKTASEIADLINHPRIVKSNVTKPIKLSIAAIMPNLSQASLKNLVNCPNLDAARLAIMNQDRLAAGFWANAFHIGQLITEEEKNFILSQLVATEDVETVTKYTERVRIFDGIKGFSNKISEEDIQKVLDSIALENN